MTMLGKKNPHRPEWEAKRIAAVRAAAVKRRGVPTGRPPTEKVKNLLKEWRNKNPKAVKSNAISNLPKDCNGEKNGNWKGGITEKTRGLRFRGEYKRWRLSVLDRDGHKCRECGAIEKLHVHHIIPISVCEALSTLRMNGVTLCQECHFKNDKCWQGERPKKMEFYGQAIALIFTIPHKFHEYPTVGNWQFIEPKTPVIFVSEEIGEKHAMLVALHELIEVVLCRNRGITAKRVDAFDMAYESARKSGDDSEPGDSPLAPYKKEHFFATSIERLMAAEMGVDWVKYEAKINELP